MNDSTDMGPLATRRQLQHIEACVAETVARGAGLLHGGRQPEEPGRGWYYEPTVLACPDQTAKTVQEDRPRHRPAAVILTGRVGARRA